MYSTLCEWTSGSDENTQRLGTWHIKELSHSCLLPSITPICTGCEPSLANLCFMQNSKSFFGKLHFRSSLSSCVHMNLVHQTLLNDKLCFICTLDKWEGCNRLSLSSFITLATHLYRCSYDYSSHYFCLITNGAMCLFVIFATTILFMAWFFLIPTAWLLIWNFKLNWGKWNKNNSLPTSYKFNHKCQWTYSLTKSNLKLTVFLEIVWKHSELAMYKNLKSWLTGSPSWLEVLSVILNNEKWFSCRGPLINQQFSFEAVP